MKPKSARRVALGLFLLIAAEFGLLAFSHMNLPPGYIEVTEASVASDLTFMAAVAAFGFVGAFIFSRRPDHRVGWLCLFLGLYSPLALLTADYAAHVFFGNLQLPGADVTAWMSGWLWAPMVSTIVLVLLVFPTGRLPSRRWRLVIWLTGLSVSLTVIVSILLWPHRGADLLVTQQVPRGAPAIVGILGNASWPILLVSIVAAASSQIVRYRRARGEEREQLKWLAVAVVIMVVAISAEQFESQSPLFDILTPLGLLAVPVAIGFAILRYRLYDIDVVINRAIVYGTLAAFITLIYVGVVIGIGTVVGSRGNLFPSIAATALIALAFQPLRRRLQRLANRVVYGERYTPYEAMSEFSHQVAGALTIEEVLPRMAEVAARGVGATRARITIFLTSGESRTHDWPGPSRDDAFDANVDISHRGEKVGQIGVAKAVSDPITPTENKLLADLASQAGAALHNVRLTEELRASRQRLVTAQDEERRKIERDIHDGAQQQLVSMSVKLGMAKSLMTRDSEKAQAMMDELKAEASQAVETLRDLARGVFPQVLVDRGLPAAVSAFVDKMRMPVTVANSLDQLRFPIEVEAAVYFVVREALQNASKHARGAPVDVTFSATDGELVFEVKDQGPGFDPLLRMLGSGLQNMRDRIEALSGSYEISSARRLGTEVRGRIPTRALDHLG